MMIFLKYKIRIIILFIDKTVPINSANVIIKSKMKSLTVTQLPGILKQNG
jgi:hypothetical protein